MKCYLNLLTLLGASLIHITSYAASGNFVIYIDAGSTSSKLHVYQYENTGSLPTIKDVFSESVKPGLTYYVDHPEQAGYSLKKILDDANQFLLDSGVSPNSAEISVLATADMRQTPEDKQHAIYVNVNEFIQANYQFSVREINTISGKMEGLYGWLTVNYLQQNFQHHNPTVGSLDMGGSSTQIAFATEDSSKPESEVTVNVNGQQYTVFSKSFSGFGQDRVRELMKHDQSAFSCFPDDYYLSPSQVGQFNLPLCGSIYADIIQQKHIENELISTAGMSFVAYSGIYYTYQFFAAEHSPDRVTLDTNIQTICHTAWDDLKTKYPKIPEAYLASYCANGAYQDKLLYDIYKLSGSQLTVTNKLAQQDIDWTQGAALFALIQAR